MRYYIFWKGWNFNHTDFPGDCWTKVFITQSRFHYEQKEIFFFLSKPKNLKTITIFIAISFHFESWIFHKRAVSSEIFTFQGRVFHNRMVSIVVVFWSTRHYDKAITMGWNLIWAFLFTIQLRFYKNIAGYLHYYPHLGIAWVSKKSTMANLSSSNWFRVAVFQPKLNKFWKYPKKP